MFPRSPTGGSTFLYALCYSRGSACLVFLKAQNLGELHGFGVSNNSEGIPLLLYVDDMMVVMDGFYEEASTIKEPLIWFNLYLGLKVIMKKLVVFEINLLTQWDKILNL